MDRNIIPKNRPKLTRGEAVTLLNGYPTTTYKVRLLGIRGYYKKTMGNPLTNDLGIYDDAIFVVGPDHFATFNANTDPSVARQNIAILKPGLHLYRKGKHKILSPLGYPALRPATPGERLPVTRGGKDDYGIAINIHKGGLHTTSSEGCQTIFPGQWDEFKNLVYAEMDRWGQSIIPYVLTTMDI